MKPRIHSLGRLRQVLLTTPSAPVYCVLVTSSEKVWRLVYALNPAETVGYFEW